MAIQQQEFEHIYKTQFRYLYELAYRVIFDKDEALDAVHNVMVRAYDLRHDLTVESARAYLASSLRHELASRLRHMEVEDRYNRWIAEDALSDAEDDSLVVMSERLSVINRVADSEFTPAVRVVFDSVFRHGRSYSDAATDNGISVSTVNKHVVTALRILRNYFSKHNDL